VEDLRRSTDPTQYDWHQEHKSLRRYLSFLMAVILLMMGGSGAVWYWAEGKFSDLAKSNREAMAKIVQTNADLSQRIKIMEYEMSKGGRYTERRGEAIESRVNRLEENFSTLGIKMERVLTSLNYIVEHVRGEKTK